MGTQEATWQRATACRLIEEYAPLARFRSLLAGDDGGQLGPDGEPREVAHLADIGADWYIYQGIGFMFYVIANQGHAGGSGLHRDSAREHRPFRFWRTNTAQPVLAQWKAALAFVTGEVNRSLEAEWGTQ